MWGHVLESGIILCSGTMYWCGLRGGGGIPVLGMWLECFLCVVTLCGVEVHFDI